MPYLTEKEDLSFVPYLTEKKDLCFIGIGKALLSGKSNSKPNTSFELCCLTHTSFGLSGKIATPEMYISQCF